MTFKFTKRALFLSFFIWLFSWNSGIAQQADSSSVEWIKIYFNMPADKSVALQNNQVNDRAYLLKTLLQLIQSAKYSIDLSIYNLENLAVGEALVAAANRGVRVRITTDDRNRYRTPELAEPLWKMLGEAGIYSIDDSGTIFHPDGNITTYRLSGASSDMHNKFAVIDILSDNPDDYYVWTGSMNLTYTGSHNTNNTIVIKDSGIAKAYAEEFNQMWGGDEDIPDPMTAKFGRNKEFIGESVFYVDTTKVELYFSPVNRYNTKPSIGDRLDELIQNYAQNDVNFLAFAITPDIPMSQTMWQRSFTDQIQLNGLIDPRFYAQYRNSGNMWAAPEAKIGNRNILAAREMRILHHKILLLDVENPEFSDRGIAVAGSYNFSRNAEEGNDENTLIFHSPEIANQFYQDFMGAMNRAQGKTDPPSPRIEHETWYPVSSVTDGGNFDIELEPRFTFPVRFLGVDTPRIYAGPDSSEFYSEEAALFLADLLEGNEIRMYGFDLFTPEVHYGSFRAYVQLRDQQENIIDVNQELIKNGFGYRSHYYRQHPDSIQAFQRYEQEAKLAKKGLWATEDKLGSLIPRVDPFAEEKEPIEYPININTANSNLLEELSGIGPSFALRIIDYREQNGGFTDIDQLVNISGIGTATLERIRPYISVE